MQCNEYEAMKLRLNDLIEGDPLPGSKEEQELRSLMWAVYDCEAEDESFID